MSNIARTKATGGTLDPDFLRWQTSLPVDRVLLREDVRGSLAHLKVLAAAGLISGEEHDLMASALTGLPERVESGAVQLPLEEDVHMSVETWLRSEVGEVADKLHTGRSRNDQVVTDFMLWCREARANLVAAVEDVREGVLEWQARHAEVVMPAYTHRQVALSVPATMWIDACLDAPAARDLRLLTTTVAEELEACPLGAGAIAGTTLDTDRRIAAQELEFARAHDNPIDAVGDRDYALSLCFAAARIALHYSRFCADVIELVGAGLARLGGAVACGSSMMPHKRNPDLFELVRADSARRQADLQALMSTIQGLGTGYHRDFQQDKTIVFGCVQAVIADARMVRLGLRHLDLEPDACLEALRKGDAVATDMCEHLVALGTPFRQAYGIVGALVAAQREAGRRLTDLEAADLEAHGLPLALLEDLDPQRSAARRAARYAPRNPEAP